MSKINLSGALSLTLLRNHILMPKVNIKSIPRADLSFQEIWYQNVFFSRCSIHLRSLLRWYSAGCSGSVDSRIEMEETTSSSRNSNSCCSLLFNTLSLFTQYKSTKFCPCCVPIFLGFSTIVQVRLEHIPIHRLLD